MNRDQAAISFVVNLLALLVGAKALYVTETLMRSPATGDVWSLFVSPYLRLPGGMFLSAVVSIPLARFFEVGYLRIADAVAPAAGLMIVGARLGCLIEGCCFGLPSSLPWAITFPAGSEAHTWQVTQDLIPPHSISTLPVHPLQLYFGAIGVLLFLVLASYQRRKRYDGEITLLFSLAFLWSTWLLEYLRAQPHELTQHLVLVGAIAMGAVFVAIECRRLVSRRLLVEPSREIAAR
jgi:phosphatidylglycerol:prolipoprotein diacylglycerol transferase